MRYGFRKPSLSRSISAMTSGAAKRALMREIVPYYGKRGMGWANPRKAAYNHLYSMTTANPIDIILDKPKRRRNSPKETTVTTCNPDDAYNSEEVAEDKPKRMSVWGYVGTAVAIIIGLVVFGFIAYYLLIALLCVCILFSFLMD